MAIISSILDSIKTDLNIPVAVTDFDNTIINHINGVFTGLAMVGLPNASNFQITDNTAVWDDIIPIGLTNKNNVKTYIYLSVRLLFDPPQNSFLVKAIEDRINKLEYLISSQIETAG